jgi:hypothetical protein
MEMLEQELCYPSVLAVLIQECICGDDLAWVEIAAIRAVEGASYEDKYSGINYELLRAVYFH